jgi:putative ABC transport system permease protein
MSHAPNQSRRIPSRPVDLFISDLVYCTRMLWKARGFTLAAIAALALGIGANTAIFSVVNAVLLRPSAFPDSDRIVFLSRKAPDGTSQGAAPAYFAHWRNQEEATGQVSAKFFQTFGATLITGRFFSPEEDLPRGPKSAIISESLWQNRFNRAADITNRSIQLAGEPYAIVGVLSNTFDFRDFAAQPEVWTPFQLDPNSVEMGSYFRVAAKLHPGFSLEQANASLAIAANEFHRKFPLWRHDQSFSAVPLQEVLVGDVRRSLWILAAAVGMVLLVACANVANLLLARGMGRKREFAIRAAIGAGRSRLIRQSLTESLILSAAGAVLGIAIGFAGIRALLKVNTADLPRIGIDGSLVTIDWRVLAFTATVTVLTAIVFGLLPALQSSRGDLSIVLRESASRSGSAGGTQSRTRTVLVISEIALAVVLLTGAALLIRTSMALAAVDPGFDPHQVITMRTSLSSRELDKTTAVHQLIRNSVERLRALPGVEGASSTCCVPLENGYGLPFQIEGRPPTKDGPYHGGGDWFTISPGYFQAGRGRPPTN